MRLFAMIFTLLLAAQLSGQSKWEWILPYPQSSQIYSGTLVGSTAYFSGENETLVKTSDGGQSFVNLSNYYTRDNTEYGYFIAQNIAFADSLHGFLTETNGQFITKDGGLNWIRIADVGSNIHIITFADNNTGWKLGGAGLYRTTDKGSSWNYLNSNLFNFAGLFTRMLALDEKNLYVLSSFHYRSGGGIYHSTNGGESFAELNTGISSDSSTQVSYYDIKFSKSGLGYAAASVIKQGSNKPEGIIFRTTDFGKSWTHQLYPDALLHHVVLFNDSTALVTGKRVTDQYQAMGIVMRTSDGGENWNRYEDALLAGAFPLYIPSMDVLIMGSYRFFRSTDKGATFIPVNRYGDLNIISEFAIDKYPTGSNQLAMAISWMYPSEYIISTNGGRDWKAGKFPQSQQIAQRHIAIAEDVIYCSMINGQLFKSTDYGESWQSFPGAYSSGYKMDVSEGGNIALAGWYYGSKTAYTEDGGTNWTIAPYDPKYYFRTLQILRPGVLFGTGGVYDGKGDLNGFVYRSENKGLDWYITKLPHNIIQAQMIDDTLGYTLSTFDMHKTTDGGKTWNLILERKDFYDQFSCFLFSDKNNGIIQKSYYFQATPNGGRTWHPTGFNTPFWGTVDQMAYNKYGDILALGNGALCIYKKEPGAGADFALEQTPSSGMKNILMQNYPNPFNPETVISYDLAQESKVKLKIYDMLGSEIAELVNESQAPGSYNVKWNASGLPSGIYIYRIEAGGYSFSRKMMLIK